MLKKQTLFLPIVLIFAKTSLDPGGNAGQWPIFTKIYFAQLLAVLNFMDIKYIIRGTFLHKWKICTVKSVGDTSPQSWHLCLFLEAIWRKHLSAHNIVGENGLLSCQRQDCCCSYLIRTIEVMSGIELLYIYLFSTVQFLRIGPLLGAIRLVNNTWHKCLPVR